MGSRKQLAGMCLIVVWVGAGRATAVTSDNSVRGLSGREYADENLLAMRLWEQSTEVLEARAAVGAAASDLMRARTYPNPNADFTWGTIPVGRTNPPGLQDPLSNVPNYSSGIAELVEIGKRGPRQRAAAADVERARGQALAILGDRFFALLGRIGQMAASQQRAAVLDQLVGASQELMDLDRARASKGDIAALDLERTEVEHARLIAERDAAVTDQTAAQGECSAIIAGPCPSFESGDAAHAFLASAAAAPLPGDWSKEAEDRRPDISALRAAASAAEERAVLAERRIIPDVTLRLGYTYDSFVLAGNQRNSLALGVQMPLPVFDRGQADLSAALSERTRAEGIREARVAAAPNQLAAAIQQRQLILQRSRGIDEALGKARSVSETMRESQRAGGTSQIEVLLARRSYQELLLERSALDGDAFNIALSIRQALGLFPRPATVQTDTTP